MSLTAVPHVQESESRRADAVATAATLHRAAGVRRPGGRTRAAARPVLSILMPVYNERLTVRAVIETVRRVAFPVSFEIIVVDDGSTDGTSEVLLGLPAWDDVRVVSHARNAGKGAAIQTALEHARGELVVVQDADEELDPCDLLPMLDALRGGAAAVCYGTRFAGDNRRLHGRATYWANRGLNGFCNLLTGLRLSDMNTCYKMMPTELARRLDLRSRGFAMEPEITVKLARLGVSIIERPIRYAPRGRREGKKIRAMDFFRYVAAMIRFRIAPFDAAGSRPAAIGADADGRGRSGRATTLGRPLIARHAATALESRDAGRRGTRPQPPSDRDHHTEPAGATSAGS